MGAENNTQTDKPRFVGKVSYVPLTEVCNPKQWKTIQKSDLLTEGYPVYGANGVIGYFDEYNHEEETVLITCRGATCGTVRMCASKSYVTGNAMCLDSLDENIDANFLMHYLRGYDFGSIISGSAQPQITRASLRRVMVPVLSKEDQLEFCRGIQSIEKTSNRLCSLLLTLDSLVKSRFVEMFNDHCARVKLSEICDTYNGDRGKNYPSEKDRVEKGIPFVNASHLSAGKVSFENMDYITEERYALLSGGKISRDDILYCLRGSLGKCAIADFECGAIASSMMLIRPDQKKILPAFLYQALISPEVTKQLGAARNGSTQPNLSAKSVRNYLVSLPNLDSQRKFVAFTRQIDKLRFAIQEQIKKLETLKASLMQEYFG